MGAGEPVTPSVIPVVMLSMEITVYLTVVQSYCSSSPARSSVRTVTPSAKPPVPDL